jgi:glutamine cyclotransferase
LHREFSYEGEGWGLAHNGEQLILSDGSATLRFLDPKTFATVRSVEVRDRKYPVRFLNELEYVKGEIYANIFKSDYVARISPRTGKVLGWIDLSGLHPKADRRAAGNVLNGVAYDKKTDRLFVTGKNWPKLFEVEVVAP